MIGSLIVMFVGVFLLGVIPWVALAIADKWAERREGCV